MSETAFTLTTVPGAPQLARGFSDPVFDAQAVFRVALDAMAYAGRPYRTPTGIEAPRPLDAATASLCLTLFDFETPVWLDAAGSSEAALAFLKFHAGVPIVSKPGDAAFALICDPASMPSLDAFAIGEDRYPDRSATLIVQVPSLDEGPATRWSGPGIDGSIECRIAGLAGGFWNEWDLNHGRYPLGIDVLFTCGDGLIGLPRGVKVEV